MLTAHEGRYAMALSDQQRVPPGQHLVSSFPVLHAGSVMHVARETWRLTVDGLVEPSLALDWDALLALPATSQTCDIHCVTTWSKLDTHWKGMQVSTLFKDLLVSPEARHAVIHAYGGWTTNLPLEELIREDVLLAYEYEGRPISDEHGGPVRLLVPRLYFWKSAKWLTRIEVTAEERLGYWERVGYHRLGDPWLEQRYS
jgi:DMSO/TMAO reductase YedYZ molybdopterin-dependent catalytic subunit